MKKLILAALVAVFAVAGPAQAHRPGDDRGGDRAEQATPSGGLGERDLGSKPEGRGRGDERAPARSDDDPAKDDDNPTGDQAAGDKATGDKTTGDKATGDDRGDRRRGDEPRKRRCTPRRVRYLAAGLYVSSELTQTQGADTTDTMRDDRYSGTLTVMVKRTNHAAKPDKGTEKVYTLTDAKVRFADRDGDGTRDRPVAGDRTVVQGRTTKLRRRCDATGFTPVLKIKKVLFLGPPQAPAPAPAPTS